MVDARVARVCVEQGWRIASTWTARIAGAGHGAAREQVVAQARVAHRVCWPLRALCSAAWVATLCTVDAHWVCTLPWLGRCWIEEFKSSPNGSDL